MKRKTKILFSMLCAVLCVAVVLSTAPISRAAGMMRLDIDEHTYTKVYTDTGALALVGWTYDASEDTLRLKNFGSAEKPQTPIFAYPYSGSMTIELNGDSYIQASGELALTVIGHIKFTGTGSLTVISTDTYGINTDYTITVSESASLNVSGLAGIMALKGMTIDTAGSVNVHTSRKCINTEGDVRIRKGSVNLTGTVGIYTTEGSVFMSGGETDVFITSTQRAIYIVNSEAYLEWSANAVVTAGAAVPGDYISEYNNEQFFHASFSGVPKLNPPRKIFWDDTVIDDAGTTNPVGRWSAVENATGYLINLYYYNDVGYELKESFTVMDALSCNFGGHFTTYGKYCFSVTPLGDGVNFIDANESDKTTEFYRFSGDVESRYYVTLPESDYFTIVPESGSTVVYYGESYSFTVEVDPAYTQSQVLVWANEQRVALRHGKYTIDNVTENLVIKIGDLSVNTYTISFPTHEAYTIYLLPEYSTEVEYGESCAFSIELSDIYMQSDLVVTANGTELIPKYGIIYTISDITIDYTVAISGLVRDSYELTYCHIDGSPITTQTVDHGYTATAPQGSELASGLEFVGWTTADGTLFDFSTPITEALTLYARYESPTENGYYLISTLEQLIWFRDEVNFGNTAINGRLCADIEMNSGEYIMVSGEPVFKDTATIWEPIGGYDYDNEANYVKFYEGSFDGDGHTLSGFYIKHDKMAAEASDIGIFGIISSKGSVKNLNVETSVFDGYGNIGSVAGMSYSPLSGCTSSAILVGVEDTGGIVGEATADISGCTFSGIITVEQYSASATSAPIGGTNAGGIVGLIGEKAAVISGCQSDAVISSYQSAGGIAGGAAVDGTVFTGCVNNSSVSAELNAGGVLGTAEGFEAEFEKITNNGTVNAKLAAGGIFANADAKVTDAVNKGPVSCERYAGGFGAGGSLDVTVSYNEGSVVSTGGCAAAFMASGNLSAGYCYNISEINGQTKAAGFLAEGGSLVLNQVHNYGEIKAETADALCVTCESSSVEQAHYRSDINSSAFGFASTTEWFYCGYSSLLLNRANACGFWAQGEDYPVFAADESESYVFPMAGDGTSNSPYIITNENELRLVSALINNESGWSAANYKLGNDVYVSNPETVNNFIPFGSSDNKFTGCFDGAEFKISGINISGDNYVALFVEIGKNGMVKNTVFDNFTVNGKTNVAVITGYNSGTVYNCDVINSQVNGIKNIGAAVGCNYGNIKYVNTDALVYGNSYAGGIAGVNEDGNLSLCFNYGDINGVDTGNTKANNIGGVTGANFVLLSYSGNSGSVSADSCVGGLIGSNYGELLSVYNGGAVAANDSFGSISGIDESDGEHMRCYYIDNTAASATTVVGTAQATHNAYNGMSAYLLNDSAKEKYWAQGENHPKIAAEDGSDAVIYTVVYYSFGTPYYFAATMKGGSAVTPPAPQVDGYNFLYWDTPYDNVTYNMTTRAVFDRDDEIMFIPTASIGKYSTEYDTFICGFSQVRKWTVADLDRQISNEKISYMNFDMYEEYEDTQPLFTGMSVVLYDDTGAYRDTVWVVIFGDIDGDGDIGGNDLVLLNLVCQEFISIDELNYAQQEAADTNRDGVVDSLDVEYLEQYLLKNKSINQSAIV